MKQLGLAMYQYTQDYDQRLPPRQSTVGPGGTLVSWRSILSPYVKNKAVYQCDTRYPDPRRGAPDIEHDGFSRSFAVNTSAGGTDGIGGPFADSHPYLLASKMKSPAEVILICESTAAYNDFNPLFPGAFARPGGEHSNSGHLYAGHQSCSNFVFADGHGKAMNPLDTIGASDRHPLNLWTVDNSPFTLEERKVAQYTLGYAVEADK